MTGHSIAWYLLPLLLLLQIFVSCNKSEETVNIKGGHQPFTYSADVIDKWMTMQIRLMRNATGIPNHGFSRHFAYSGLVALEALRPGFPLQAKWSAKWNGLQGLPIADHSKEYYYPANVNAALAAINRAMFPNATSIDKQAIDSLETALHQSFPASVSSGQISKSVNFGKAVATAVFNWAETDGYKSANNPYTIPTGDGKWKPTFPAFANPATPYWGNNRPIIHNSTVNTQVEAPISYSADPHSAFYQMVKQVYTVSQYLTDDQKAMAMFWRDVPGVSSPGHWLSILQQTIRKDNSTLDKAALAYALTGISINDALIACFKVKYQYSLVRPVTYIREVMGHSNWAPYLGTPAHPEYLSAHSSLSAAAAVVLEKIFGRFDSFTDHTYDYLGMAPRQYESFTAIGAEAGLSRLYAGIHYQASIDAGTWQGRKVADNIFDQRNTR